MLARIEKLHREGVLIQQPSCNRRAILRNYAKVAILRQYFRIRFKDRFLQLNGPAKVAGVLEGSAAAKAGLKAGDVLTKIGDKSVDSAKAAHAAVALFRPGSKVELRVQRGDRTIELNVVAGEGF